MGAYPFLVSVVDTKLLNGSRKIILDPGSLGYEINLKENYRTLQN
jgi:hypothetical protein